MANETVLIVDDDREIIKILRGYLEQAGFTVLAAYDGASALLVLRRERPDLLLLDLMLPNMDGWALTRQIRTDAMLLTTPILMITAKVDDADKIIGLELGADDYITKPFNAREVVARVRAMLRRTQLDRQTGTEVYVSDDLRLDVFQRSLTLRDEPIELTPTEFKLLLKLMANPGHTFSREELLETAFGDGYEGFGHTLDTHIANLRRKIEPDLKNPMYIQTVYSVGYRFKREESRMP
jgi:two-component system alkaline phosphatase synthesis response regulator PhoP